MRTKSVREHAQPDGRDLEDLLDSLFPFDGNDRLLNRLFDRWEWRPVAHFRWPRCEVCSRKAKTKRLVVSPITLQRSYSTVCNRRRCADAITAWEGVSRARRNRAQLDWAHENGQGDALELIGYLPPQYPSLSRSTLRKFLASDAPVATVQQRGSVELSVTALNGSIRSLGFEGDVYAEIRSGQAVLRRVASRPS